MSVAWKDPVDLWREPALAIARRVGVRGSLGLALIVAAWLVPWLWLTIVLAVLAVPFVVNLAAALINWTRHHGVLLRLMPTGTLEWPRSIQEQWLGREGDWVDGTEIEVVPPAFTSKQVPSEPRVTLRGASRQIANFPLYGRTAQEFVDAVGPLVADRGITLRVAKPAPAVEAESADDASTDGAEASED